MILTKKRVELLQAVADGEVTDQYSVGLGWFVEWDRGPGWEGGNGTRRFSRPTAAVQALRDNGLVRISRPTGAWHDPRLWELTSDGRAALEANGGKP